MGTVAERYNPNSPSEITQKVVNLGRSSLEVVRGEIKEFGEGLSKKTTALLLMTLIVGLALASLTVTLILLAVNLGAEPWIACAVATALNMVAFAVSLYYFKRPMTDDVGDEQSTALLKENFSEAKEAVEDGLQDLKQRALDKIDPRNIVKENSKTAVIGSFAAGIALAALANNRKR